LVLAIHLNYLEQILQWQVVLNLACYYSLVIARYSIDLLVKVVPLMVLESAQGQVSGLELELLMVVDLDAIDLDRCWERGRELVLRQGWLLVLALALAHRSVLAMESLLDLE
jgi:hypothetical protein